jgi:hypothetical protein
MDWLPHSKAQYEKLRRRAIESGHYDEFRCLHNEVIRALCDLDQASEVGERLKDSKRPGGEVRLWVHGHISVTFALLHRERVGWILNYASSPISWLD